MNEIAKLKNDARANIAAHHAISLKRSAVAVGELNAGYDDIEEVVNRFAAIGYALEDALARV